MFLYVLTVIENPLWLVADREEVFDSLDDVRNDLRWSPHVPLMAKITETRSGLAGGVGRSRSGANR